MLIKKGKVEEKIGQPCTLAGGAHRATVAPVGWFEKKGNATIKLRVQAKSLLQRLRKACRSPEPSPPIKRCNQTRSVLRSNVQQFVRSGKFTGSASQYCCLASATRKPSDATFRSKYRYKSFGIDYEPVILLLFFPPKLLFYTKFGKPETVHTFPDVCTTVEVLQTPQDTASLCVANLSDLLHLPVGDISLGPALGDISHYSATLLEIENRSTHLLSGYDGKAMQLSTIVDVIFYDRRQLHRLHTIVDNYNAFIDEKPSLTNMKSRLQLHWKIFYLRKAISFPVWT